MEVEIKEHRARNVITKKIQTLPQYKVYLDGRRVGFIGWHEDAKLLLIEELGPVEQVELELRVGWLLNREVTSNTIPEIQEPAKAPGEEVEDVYGDELNA